MYDEHCFARQSGRITWPAHTTNDKVSPRGRNEVLDGH